MKNNKNKNYALLIKAFTALTLSFACMTQFAHGATLPINIFADADKMEMKFQNELSGQLRLAQKNLAVKRPQTKDTQQMFLTSDEDGDYTVEKFLELSRINLLIGAFTELDLKVVKFKVQPYVEFRFDK